MANLPAAKKSIRADKKKQQRNTIIKTKLKTLVKKLSGLIDQKKQQEAADMLRQVMSALDKAAKRGIIKKGAASRKKARLSRKVLKIKNK